MTERLQPDPRVSFPAIPDSVARLDAATAPESPLALLQDWVSAVLEIAAREPMYVTLATASPDGIPSSRTVQLLEVEDEALRFTTNSGSRKGVEMTATGRAAVSVFWG
jgi:pyridoxamine 5'-phosphate oxidase